MPTDAPRSVDVPEGAHLHRQHPLPRVVTRPQGVQQPLPTVLPQDRNLSEILCQVVASTAVRDGRVIKDRILLYLLTDPAAFQRLGRELAEKLHKSGGAQVIAGIGEMGNSLMGHVAQFYDELQQGPDKAVVPPVFRFETKDDGGKPGFVCEGAEQVIRGKTVFLVTPVLTQTDSALIGAYAGFLEGLRYNGSVVGVGTIITYGELQKPKDAFRDLHLLQNLGLG